MRKTLCVWMASVALAGCVPTPRTAPGVSQTSFNSADTIWYVSARDRDKGRPTRRLADSLEFGMVISQLNSKNDFLTHAFSIDIRDSVPLTQPAFVASLRHRAFNVAGGDPMAVLYVHGFGTGQHEAFSHATQASVRSRSDVPWVVFSWPSRGSGVTWPRANALFAAAYWEDSALAVASGPAFASALNTVLDAVGGAHLVLVAHSLGSQLTSETLVDNELLRQRLKTDPLRAYAFFSPDVDANRFGDVIVPAMLPLTQRLLLYASTNDRILTLSKNVNKGNRAGLIRGSPQQPIIRERLETIDVTAGVAAGGWFQRAFGSHHGLSRASAALFDITQLVARGFPAECRSTIGTATQNASGDWRLTDVALPALSATDACRRRQ